MSNAKVDMWCEAFCQILYEFPLQSLGNTNTINPKEIKNVKLRLASASV